MRPGDEVDDLSRRTSATLANGRTVGFTYEADSALDTLSHNFAGSADDVTFTFGYTAANQVQSKAISNAAYMYATPGLEDSYTVNGLNQYISVNDGSFPHLIDYDANGNLTSDGGRDYTYDVENRLTAVTGAGTDVVYEYDPLGRLAKKRVNGAVTEQYSHDGDSIIADFDGAGTVMRRYIRGAGVDEIVAVKHYPGGTFSHREYIHTDYLGSVIALSDASGNLADRYRYSTYGEVDAPSGIPYRYTGRRYDADMVFSFASRAPGAVPPCSDEAPLRAPLYHYRARWYSPVLGRFMQTDPIGYDGGINLYGYANNDPVNLTDPSGNIPFVAACLLLPQCRAAVGAVVGAVVSVGAEFIAAQQTGEEFTLERGVNAGLIGGLQGAAIANGSNPFLVGSLGSGVHSFSNNVIAGNVTDFSSAGGAFLEASFAAGFGGLFSQGGAVLGRNVSNFTFATALDFTSDLSGSIAFAASSNLASNVGSTVTGSSTVNLFSGTAADGVSRATQTIFETLLGAGNSGFDRSRELAGAGGIQVCRVSGRVESERIEAAGGC